MNHIKKEFDGLQVLKDVSIHVNEGEVVSIIGSSGSGKSTLLRCATLLTLIDDGEVSYMGNKTVWTENGKVCLPNKTKLKEIQSCFGLVFQNFNLFPHYTAFYWFRCRSGRCICSPCRAGTRTGLCSG